MPSNLRTISHVPGSSGTSFPSTLREVLVYYRENASPVEQRWILGSLLEGLRIVRRHDRETSAAAAK